jgi:hypothetical protein
MKGASQIKRRFDHVDSALKLYMRELKTSTSYNEIVV